jgi:hypothetical protein
MMKAHEKSALEDHPMFKTGIVMRLAALTLLCLLPSAGLAQNRKPAGDRVRLNPEAPNPGDRSTFQDLRDGKVGVEASHKELLKKMAEWFVFRLTHEEYQFKKFQPDSGQGMKNLLDDAFRAIIVPAPQKPLSDGQQKFMQEFGKELVAAIKEVLNNERPIARVNAAVILAKLGETGIDSFAEAMCEVVENPNHDDAVKLYAMTGLKNLFDAKGEDRIKNEELETRCVKALIAYLNRKPPDDLSAKSPGEVEAMRYVRREAIRALGATHLPAVGKARQIDAIPSFELLRLVSNTAESQPPLSLSERVEAAIGLCLMQRRYWPERSEYQPEYAAYHIGRFIIELAAAYDNERGQTTSTDWKYLAAILAQALGQMKAEANGKWPKLDGVVARGTAVLNGIVEGRGTDQIALINFLEQNTPEAKELLKGESATAIKPAEPTEK